MRPIPVVVKIEFTPLSLDRKIFPFKKGFKKKFSKTDLPFIFCKIGLRNSLFIFGRKMVICCSVMTQLGSADTLIAGFGASDIFFEDCDR